MNELGLSQVEADVVFTGINKDNGTVHTACLWECQLHGHELYAVAARYGQEWNEQDGGGTVTVIITDFRAAV